MKLEVGDWYDFADYSPIFLRRCSRVCDGMVYGDKLMHKKSRELYTDSDPIGLTLAFVRKLTKIELILYGLENE